MFGSFRDCAGKSVLNCLQAFNWRRVDAVEKEVGMDKLRWLLGLVIKYWA